jgi:hypothetical protein
MLIVDFPRVLIAAQTRDKHMWQRAGLSRRKFSARNRSSEARLWRAPTQRARILVGFMPAEFAESLGCREPFAILHLVCLDSAPAVVPRKVHMMVPRNIAQTVP